MMTAFDKSVFIDCPFDNNYRPLLRPLLFTIIFVLVALARFLVVELEPRLAQARAG